MSNPVRPKFEQEYIERKMAEQQRAVNTKEVKVNNNENKRESVENEESNGGKNMNTLLKIILSIGIVGSVGLIVLGISTYQTTKENSAKEAASIVQVQATDTANKSNIEQRVDNTLKYQQEAEQFWNDNLICSKNEFINKYIQYRENGLTAEQARDSLYNEFSKENQVAMNEDGEVVAEPTEMDALINSEDDDITEEVVEEAVQENQEVTYEIREIEPETLYATQQVNKRQGPSAKDFDKIGSLSYGEKVTVVGVVEQYNDEVVLWYQLDTGEFVSGAYLVEKLPNSQPKEDNNSVGTQSPENKGNNGNNNDNTQAPNNNNTPTVTVDKLKELGFGGGFSGAGGGQATVGDGSGNFSGVDLQ
ncbi:MAG: SH3 domain-containing protein [Lachnospiraceae bacterium]|nr:SH3 domain-containing protein [Lachnospiraceae bacterium]